MPLPIVEISHRTIEIRAGEIIDALEIRKRDEIVFYSYDYKIKNGRGWSIYVRWDNFLNQPHIDRYDENENHVERISCREKSIKEILEVVEIFGKNLISMDLSRV